MAGITKELERLLRHGRTFITNGQLDPEAAGGQQDTSYLPESSKLSGR